MKGERRVEVEREGVEGGRERKGKEDGDGGCGWWGRDERGEGGCGGCGGWGEMVREEGKEEV